MQVFVNPSYTAHNFTTKVQLHRAIHHMTDHRFAVLRANGDEIRALLRIIVTLPAFGSAWFLPLRPSWPLSINIEAGSQHPVRVRGQRKVIGVLARPIVQLHGN